MVHPTDLVTLAAHIAEDEEAIHGLLPDRDLVASFADGVVSLLFPDGRQAPRTPAGIRAELEARCRALTPVLAPLREKLPSSPDELAERFMDMLPAIHEQLTLDADAIEAGDPAAHGTARGRPRLPGLPGHRRLPRSPTRCTSWACRSCPRMITEMGPRPDRHRHPPRRHASAPACFIDHGTGVVIGETAVIGNDVKLYQGVTLGALVA